MINTINLSVLGCANTPHDYVQKRHVTNAGLIVVVLGIRFTASLHITLWCPSRSCSRATIVFNLYE